MGSINTAPECVTISIYPPPTEKISFDHILQKISQIVATKFNLCVYVCASESGLLFSSIIFDPNVIVKHGRDSLNPSGGPMCSMGTPIKA